jgi:hypothetical protein
LAHQLLMLSARHWRCLRAACCCAALGRLLRAVCLDLVAGAVIALVRHDFGRAQSATTRCAKVACGSWCSSGCVSRSVVVEDGLA